MDSAVMEDAAISKPSSRPDLEVLDRATCLALISSLDVGRLAWAEEDRVMVFPLNFALDGDDIIFRTPSRSLCDAVASGTCLTFQADDVEPALRSGWTVVASGPASEVTDPVERERLSRLVSPWRRMDDLHVIRLTISWVTGRRLPAHAGGIASIYLGP
jgi:uncharacterized protein